MTFVQNASFKQARKNMRNWILRDQCDDHLIEAVERNTIEHMLFFALRHPEMYVAIQDDFTILNTKISSPLLNYVFTSRFIAEDMENRIKRTISYFRDKKLPFSWVIGPTASFDIVSQVLENLGMQKKDSRFSMVMNLHGFRKKARYIPGFRIQQALTRQTLFDVAKVYASAKEFEEPIQEYFTKISSLAFHGSDPIQLFIGYLQEEPVIVGELYFGAGIVGLKTFVAESMQERAKELVTDLIIKMLCKAKEQSYHWASVRSQKEHCPIYDQLGFKSYCEFAIYN